MDLIAHYRVVDSLGEGGMGEVYRAYDERLGRPVALKLLKKRDDPRAIDRFFRESRAASALNHPNIVTVFDAGHSDFGPFIVMELVRGRMLRSLMGEEFDAGRFLSVARQTSEALTVAHAAGIVHRDVKPENIMIRDDGYVKVLDFGLARVSQKAQTDATTQAPTETDSRTIMGTVKYMSPEQAVGHPVGSASDIFSLGVVLYELGTGQHPFGSESQFGVLHSILSHPPVPPARLNPELAGRIDALLLRMLDKDAHHRPSAAEVSAEIAAVVAGPVRRQSSAAVVIDSRRRSVGRAKAHAELHGAFSRVGQGHGLLVCVSGEAGIGKSTLVEDFLADLADGDVACHMARGRCSERLAGTEAYLPILDALDDLVHRGEGALATTMKVTAPLWFLQVASSEIGEASLVRLASEGRAGTQERLKREFVAFLSEACRSRPVVLFFDDLHWVDISTIDILGYAMRQCESLPVLIIVTYRPEELLVREHPFLSTKLDLQSRGSCREVTVEFLSRTEIDQLITLSFPNHRLPAQFSDLIYKKTEGNPLFAVNLLRYLADKGALAQESDGWRLTRPLADIAGNLPESLRGMIQRKLAGLAEDDRRLLTVASVQGDEFDGAIVATVLGKDPADVEERLDLLDRVHGLVRRVRENELPDGTLTLRYRFVHVLYQNMLYGDLTPARRTSFSMSVAKAIEACSRDRTADVALELAILYEAARAFAPASDYFCVAAKQAVEVFAYEEAFALGRRALDALRALPDEPERRRRELAILLTMGVPASASRGFSSEAARNVYDRAKTLCLEFNEIGPLARVLYGLVTSNVVRLQLESVEEARDRLTELGRAGHDPSLGVHGLNASGLISYYRGEFQAAVDQFDEMADLCSLDERRAICGTYGYDPACAARLYRCWSRWCLGYPDAALRDVEEAMVRATEVGHRYMQGTALTFAAAVASWRGDWDRLRDIGDRTLALAQQEGFAYFVPTTNFLMGFRLARLGDREQGLDRMRKAMDALRALGGRTSLRRFSTDFAEQLALDGNVDEAADLLAAEFETVRSDHFWDAELERTRGEVLLQRGTDQAAADAERCFEQAVVIAREQMAKSFELRALSSLCRLWRRHGRAEEGVARLSECARWFSEGLETADLREAQQLIADSG